MRRLIYVVALLMPLFGRGQTIPGGGQFSEAESSGAGTAIEPDASTSEAAGDSSGTDMLTDGRMSTSTGEWICLLEAKTGPCRASFPRFYFDTNTMECEEFTYGGCQGNANRFTTLQECMARCEPTAVQSYIEFQEANGGRASSPLEGNRLPSVSQPIDFRVGDDLVIEDIIGDDSEAVIEDVLRAVNLAPAMPSLVKPPVTAVEDGDSTTKPSTDLSDPSIELGPEELLLDEEEDRADFIVLPDSPVNPDPTAAPQTDEASTGGAPIVGDQDAKNSGSEIEIVKVVDQDTRPSQDPGAVDNSAQTLGCTVYMTVLLCLTLVFAQLVLL